ncbi:hypothetical protein OJ996_07755 [Luteolibacter sp. GHJ8]|uniref:Uncharacterized protein n=1 Tax=Luteolibacter rhizosphaerae TaxID=2989719 RepID=A0ABT3G0U6_9BACT|nr:hypothetical protein [Luteolibacter rhizosphaerae]MCW1913463.1 hypothetical protein [Luteolibacter rhizosphaerae]
MIAASGSYNDIFLVEEALGFSKMPTVIRTRLELVSADKTKNRSAVLTGRSGEEATLKVEGLEANVTGEDWSFSLGAVDLLLTVQWADAGSSKPWGVSTALTLEEGKRTLVAGQGTGQDRWQLFATASIEMTNGLPLREARWTEKEGRLEPWPRVAANDNQIRKPIGSDLSITMYRFANPWSRLRNSPEPFAPLPQVVVPDALSNWMRGPVADVGAILFEGLANPAWFAGFDSRSGRILVLADAEAQDRCESRLNTGVVDPIVGENLWVGSNPSSGAWLLACRAREEARIYAPEVEAVPAFEVSISELGDHSYDLQFAAARIPLEGAAARISGEGLFKLVAPDFVTRKDFMAEQGDGMITIFLRRSPP